MSSAVVPTSSNSERASTSSRTRATCSSPRLGQRPDHRLPGAQRPDVEALDLADVVPRAKRHGVFEARVLLETLTLFFAQESALGDQRRARGAGKLVLVVRLSGTAPTLSGDVQGN